MKSFKGQDQVYNLTYSLLHYNPKELKFLQIDFMDDSENEAKRSSSIDSNIINKY